ncbi:MAG: hypothetical protein GX832_01505 [Clostridiales bacterium]|nr:hypothetical protein [Clostridiales bacterium]
MQKDNGLFILEVADNYLDTLEDSVHEGDLGAGKVLKIWEDILTNAADETKVKIERISDFQSLIQYALEYTTTAEKDFPFYYDGDINDNIWSLLSERTDFRIERPIYVRLHYVLNEDFINYKCDSRRSNLYIHNLLRFISQIPGFDIEIYESDKTKSTVLFSYGYALNGFGFSEPDQPESLYFCCNKRLSQLSSQELEAVFSGRKKAMLVKEEFTDFIDVLANREEQAPTYVYLPHIHLYMGSQALRERMYQENAIDSIEYETWGFVHSFIHEDKVRASRFIVSAKALSNAYEYGFVKVHGGVMQLEQYKNDFLEDIDRKYNSFSGKNMLVLDKSTDFAVPNVMVYSEPKHTLLIRTNINKCYRLTRLANEVVKQELAQAFYHYFDSVYTGTIF